MYVTWILLGLVGWGLAQLFLFILFRMSSDQDRPARRERKCVDACPEVTITHFGAG